MRQKICLLCKKLPQFEDCYLCTYCDRFLIDAYDLKEEVMLLKPHTYFKLISRNPSEGATIVGTIFYWKNKPLWER